MNGGAPGLIGRLVGRIGNHFAQARTRRHLSALDDHMLRDLGIARSEIDDLISGGRRS